MMTEPPGDVDLDWFNWPDGEDGLTPVADTPDVWGELDAILAERVEPEPAMTQSTPFLASEGKNLLGWPDVPAAPVADLPTLPLKQLTLPPQISRQGLWAEIGHLFQTAAFREPETVTATEPPPVEVEIDALSQALLANDGDSIQVLVHQIQQTYDEAESIKIFLAATRNLCC